MEPGASNEATWADWFHSLALVAVAGATVYVGRFVMKNVFAPGTNMQSFFMTTRELDSAVMGVLGSCVALLLLCIGIMYRYASIIRQKDILRLKLWQILNIFAFALQQILVGVNIRIDTGTRHTPDFYTLFTPAPWAFAIWAVIFLWEMVFVVWQALPSQRSNNLLAAISPYFIMANLSQTLWCFAFCPYAQRVLVVAACFLGSIAVSLSFAHYEFTAKQNYYRSSYTWQLWFFVQLPLTLHFGWTTAATLVNSNSILARADAPLYIQIAFSLFCLYAAAAIALCLMFLRYDAVYGLTVTWAIWGVRGGTGLLIADTAVTVGSDTLNAQLLTAEVLAYWLLLGAAIIMLLKLLRMTMYQASLEMRNRVFPPFLLTDLE
uniref:Uncharacterized protein n=1 Tax=Eutreptiella gymnastica TaxID=73025 RepID=A0A6T2A2S8_9EUGL